MGVQTKKLMMSHRSAEIELNKWWAMTPQNWKCPCCERSKIEIVCTNASKILIAKLVSHHDHIGDIIHQFSNEIEKFHAEVTVQNALRIHLKNLPEDFSRASRPQ